MTLRVAMFRIGLNGILDMYLCRNSRLYTSSLNEVKLTFNNTSNRIKHRTLKYSQALDEVKILRSATSSGWSRVTCTSLLPTNAHFQCATKNTTNGLRTLLQSADSQGSLHYWSQPGKLKSLTTKINISSVQCIDNSNMHSSLTTKWSLTVACKAFIWVTSHNSCRQLTLKG